MKLYWGELVLLLVECRTRAPVGRFTNDGRGGKKKSYSTKCYTTPICFPKKRWKIRKGTEYILKSSLLLREMINLASSSCRVRSCVKVLRDWLLFRKQKKLKTKNSFLALFTGKYPFFTFISGGNWGRRRGGESRTKINTRGESQAGTFVPHLTSHPLLSLPTFFLFFPCMLCVRIRGNERARKKRSREKRRRLEID